MLPYLAAAGHNEYVKSLVLYLHQMDRLQETHWGVYAMIREGIYMIRGTNSCWIGLFSVLGIKLFLMSNIKSVRRLT